MAKPIGADRKRTAANLHKALGAELTELRTSRGWSQQTLAEKLGYHINYIGLLERGEKSPTLRTIADLAEIFGTTVSGLMRSAERRVEKGTRPHKP